MNLELLYWSSANGGPARTCSHRHSPRDLTSRFHVRPDGSTYQVARFRTRDASDGSYNSGDFRSSDTSGEVPPILLGRVDRPGRSMVSPPFTEETGENRFLLIGRSLRDYYLGCFESFVKGQTMEFLGMI